MYFNSYLIHFSFYLYLQYQSALIFDAVYMLAHAVTEVEKGNFLTAPNTTCDDINPWDLGKQLFHALSGVNWTPFDLPLYCFLDLILIFTCVCV